MRSKDNLLHHQLLAQAVSPEINRLAARRKLIRKCFNEFARLVYPGAPEDQLRELRTAFFAGAAELHAMMLYGSSEGMEVSDRDMEFMAGIVAEMEEFHANTIAAATVDRSTSN